MANQSEPDTTFTRLAMALGARVDDLADSMLARARGELPAWLFERLELYESIRHIARESIRAELVALAAGEHLPDECPAIDAEWARLAAQVDGPVSGVVDGYRRGHQVQWEGWFELVEGEVGDGDARRAMLERGSRFFFAYAGRVSRLAADEYTRERDRLVRGREQRRMHVVGQLLAGRDVEPAELDYNLEGHHVGVVAWGRGAPDAVRHVASSLDRRLLLVGVVEDAWWAWLGGDRPLSTEGVRRLRAPWPGEDVRLAFGSEASGPEGFRLTHRQAATAQRAALRTGATQTHHREVALEALAAADDEQAREFAARELRGLDGDDVRSGRLRETLEAYFTCGHNAAAAAAALGVHEQTVAQRLRSVEERTGASVASRRAELEVALRLRRFLANEGQERQSSP